MNYKIDNETNTIAVTFGSDEGLRVVLRKLTDEERERVHEDDAADTTPGRAVITFEERDVDAMGDPRWVTWVEIDNYHADMGMTILKQALGEKLPDWVPDVGETVYVKH